MTALTMIPSIGLIRYKFFMRTSLVYEVPQLVL